MEQPESKEWRTKNLEGWLQGKMPPREETKKHLPPNTATAHCCSCTALCFLSSGACKYLDCISIVTESTEGLREPHGMVEEFTALVFSSSFASTYCEVSLFSTTLMNWVQNSLEKSTSWLGLLYVPLTFAACTTDVGILLGWSHSSSNGTESIPTQGQNASRD